MSDLMFEWYKIDPDPSLGGGIALSIEVLSKTLKQACFQYKASEGGNTNFVLLNDHNTSVA